MRLVPYARAPTTSAAGLGVRDVEKSDPVTAVEADRAFAGLQVYDRIIVAVSGGADSTALMSLVISWAQRHDLSLDRFHAVTVDHGLRPGSADEAAKVAVTAASLGISHTIQTYDGPVPAAPFAQSWARDLRYRLLVEATNRVLPSHGRAAVLTAHHQDDQAETVLMRLARGSGIDGLAGIRRIRRLDDRVDLIRPLLGNGKDRLMASLQAAGLPWVDDPSNTNPRFERVRLRTRTTDRDKLGFTSSSLALSAARAGRASAALNAMTDRFLAGPAVDVHPLGFVSLDWAGLLAEPEDIRVRALACIIASVGGRGSVPLSALEAFSVGAHWSLPTGKTIGHCSFLKSRATAPGTWLDIVREPGRGPKVAVPVTSLGRALWDGRLRLEVGSGVPDTADIRWLSADGLEQAMALGGVAPSVPRAVLLTAPSVWQGGALLSAPALEIEVSQLRVAPFILPRLALIT